MKIPLYILAGIPISFVILIPFVGGVEDAGSLMILSIVCTAGVSLVVWIPVWFILGWIAAAICGMAGLTPESKNPSQILSQHERNVKGVVKYMRRAKASGVSDVQITYKLEEAAWSSAVIDDARKQLAQLPPDSQFHTS